MMTYIISRDFCYNNKEHELKIMHYKEDSIEHTAQVCEKCGWWG